MTFRQSSHTETRPGGYFARDPSLKAFLTSRRAVHAFMVMILCFIQCHTIDTCRRIIDAFAVGGDGGVTYLAMRVACNLPTPKDKAKRPDETCHSNVPAAARRLLHLWQRRRPRPVCVEDRALQGGHNRGAFCTRWFATIGRRGIFTPSPPRVLLQKRKKGSNPHVLLLNALEAFGAT